MKTTGTCGVFERVARGELTPEEGAWLLAPSLARRILGGIAFALLMLFPWACAALLLWVGSLLAGYSR